MPRQYSACFPGNANQRIIKSRATIPLECQGGVTVGLSVVNGRQFCGNWHLRHRARQHDRYFSSDPWACAPKADPTAPTSLPSD